MEEMLPRCNVQLLLGPIPVCISDQYQQTEQSLLTLTHLTQREGKRHMTLAIQVSLETGR